MNDYLFELLVDKSVKRKVKILSSLLEEELPIPLKTLASSCHVSYKTLQNDVSDLIADLPDSLVIEEFNHTLAIARVGNHKRLISHIDYLVSDNPLFHIIESIFYEERKDLTSYALDLNISESTMKNYLKILQNTLNKFNLSLDFNDFSLVGTESDIRYFYFQYFRYIHESSFPLMEDKHYEEISGLFQLLKEKYMLNINFDYMRATLWIFIIGTRTKNLHFVQFPSHLLDKYQMKETYRAFKSAFLSYYKLESSQNKFLQSEILFSYFAQVDTIIYESNNTYFTNDFINEFIYFDRFIIDFFVQAKENLALNHKAKAAMQSYLTNLSILSECTELFQKYSLDLIRKAEKRYPVTFSTWYTILKKQDYFSYNRDIAARLTLLYEVKKYNKKKVLFALTGDSSSVSYFKALAKKIISKDIEYYFLFNRPLTNELLKNLQIDLCVFNFEPVERLTATNLYRLSDIPLDIEWQDLQRLLINV